MKLEALLSVLPMSRNPSDEQAKVYVERAEEYDVLIRAEDADGALPVALAERIELEGAVIADVGAGTGRIARLLGGRVRHVHLVERAAPMLAVAKARLAVEGIANVTLHEADARELPLDTDSVDAAVAGWVFGHFRRWMPEGWEDEVDRAIAEMQRVVRASGPVLIIETLGTGHETPRTHEALDEYFARLEEHHGFRRTWIRTDYQFDDAETAAEVLGGFFGDAMADRTREEGWARVPECTAIFERRA